MPRLPKLPNSQAFMLRTLPDGRRQASWRLWVLIWLLPVVFGLGAAFMAVDAMIKTSFTVPTTGEVVRVYSWEGEAGVSPLFRYTWTDGTETEATPGLRHPDWNFEIGSVHPIRYYADRKDSIVLEGSHNWFVAMVIAIIAIVLVVPALYLHWRTRRWLAKGTIA